jgi:hypothetical protein
MSPSLKNDWTTNQKAASVIKRRRPLVCALLCSAVHRLAVVSSAKRGEVYAARLVRLVRLALLVVALVLALALA